MRLMLKTPKCPKCGKPAIGSSDFIPGCALFDGDPSEGAVDYAGETKVYWDGQFNASDLADPPGTPPGDAHAELTLLEGVPREQQMQVQCDDGHEWITSFKTKE